MTSGRPSATNTVNHVGFLLYTESKGAVIRDGINVNISAFPDWRRKFRMLERHRNKALRVDGRKALFLCKYLPCKSTIVLRGGESRVAL